MILLTGATGYLGSQIAREIAARGLPLRVLVRDPAGLGAQASLRDAQGRLCLPVAGTAELPDARARGREIVVGDVTDPAALRGALRGADAVIHTAALVKMWVRHRHDFWRINVEGFQNLVRLAAEAGVRRIVYTSSFLALGPSADPSAGENLVHHGPYANEYEETKAQALAWLRPEGREFPVVTLFPGVIYGPGPKTQGNLVGGMIDQYLAGKFPGLLGSGNQRWSFAYIADVVGAHLAALEKGTPGEEYMLAGDNRSLNDFFRVLASVSGVNHPVRHMPFWAGKIAGAIEVARARLFGHTPQLTPGVVEIFKHEWVYSSAKAERDLGYHVTPLEEGLRRTLGH